MSALFALSLISVFCLLGMALRRRVPLFRSALVPATVIAGFLGMIAMNAGLSGLLAGMDSSLFAALTAQLFTLSFISIGLARPPREASPGSGPGGRRRSGLLLGAWAMGLTWVVMFTAQALTGFGVVAATGGPSGMDPMYGLLAAFAFAQGPGQAATFGAIFAQQGWEDAVPVGLAFAAAGFVAAFALGVPLARWGMRRGLARHAAPFSPSVQRGYHASGEDTEPIGSQTTFSGSIDTLSLHLAVMGVCYLLAHGLAWLFAFLPGFLGTTMSGLMFFNGLLAAYLVRGAMTRLGLDHLLDPGLQNRITGFTSDFLVVSSFMAVQLAVVLAWIVPILATIVVVTALTVLIALFLGQRYGSDHDFERAMGMYGTGTGTTPTGLALVRIIDPGMRTRTMAEMGLMNLPEMAYLPAMLVISAAFAGTLGAWPAAGILAALLAGYVLLMVLTRCIGPRTWTLREGAVPAPAAAADAADPVRD